MSKGPESRKCLDQKHWSGVTEAQGFDCIRVDSRGFIALHAKCCMATTLFPSVSPWVDWGSWSQSPLDPQLLQDILFYTAQSPGLLTASTCQPWPGSLSLPAEHSQLDLLPGLGWPPDGPGAYSYFRASSHVAPRSNRNTRWWALWKH